MTTASDTITPDVVGNVIALPETGEALLTAPVVAAALGMSVSTLWSQARTDDAFPQPVRRGERFTRWRLSEVRAYMAGLGHGDAKPSPGQRSRGVASTG